MDQGAGEFTPTLSPKEQATAIFAKAIPIGSELPYPLPKDTRFLPKNRYKKLLSDVPLCTELVRADLSTISQVLLNHGLPAIEIAQQMQSLYEAAGKPVRYLDEFPMGREPNPNARKWRKLLKSLEDYTGTAIRLDIVKRGETAENIQVVRAPLSDEEKNLPFEQRIDNAIDIPLLAQNGVHFQHIRDLAQTVISIHNSRSKNETHRLTPEQEKEYYEAKLEVEKEYLKYLISQ